MRTSATQDSSEPRSDAAASVSTTRRARIRVWLGETWPSLFAVVLACLCLAMLVLNQRLQAQMVRQQQARSTEVNALRTERDSVKEALWDERSLVYDTVGRLLHWPESLERVGDLPSSPGSSPGRPLTPPRLVIVLNEEACNACQNGELAFAETLAKQVPAGTIRAVVVSSVRRYAASMAHVNQVTFPVYFDPNNLFAGRQGITHAPAVVLLDADGRVVLAHYPLPGQDFWAAPFRSVCRRVLNVPK